MREDAELKAVLAEEEGETAAKLEARHGKRRGVFTLGRAPYEGSRRHPYRFEVVDDTDYCLGPGEGPLGPGSASQTRNRREGTLITGTGPYTGFSAKCHQPKTAGTIAQGVQSGRPSKKTVISKVPFSVTLKDLDTTKNFSSKCQKLAAVPEQKFEGMIGEWKEKLHLRRS